MTTPTQDTEAERGGVIKRAIIDCPEQSNWEVHVVGEQGVTEIRKATRPGMYCDIPYIEVWHGDKLAAEYCQHNIVGVRYDVPEVVGDPPF